MDKDIYQKQYDFELEQRNVIASSTNTPVVSITVIGGALSSMVMSFPYSHNIPTYIFCPLAFLSSIFIVLSLVYIFRSVIGYTYQKFPPAAALSEHYTKLLEWHRENETDEAILVQEAQNDFDEYYLGRLSEAAENNGDNNIERGNHIHDSTVFIACALAFLAVSAPFYIYARSSVETEVYKIEVVTPVTITNEAHDMAEKDSSNGGTGGNSPTQTGTPAKQPEAPLQTKPKPSGPPNIEFKGSTDIGSKATSNAPPPKSGDKK